MQAKLPREVVKSLLPSIFHRQVEFQKELAQSIIGSEAKIPSDNVVLFSYHVQAMVEEMGELMKSDKRWKTHRNIAYDPENKLEEICDCFITLMNIAMYSGFSGVELSEAINKKIDENLSKLREERYRGKAKL